MIRLPVIVGLGVVAFFVACIGITPFANGILLLSLAFESRPAGERVGFVVIGAALIALALLMWALALRFGQLLLGQVRGLQSSRHAGR
jgi:hypothetical protein